MRALELFQFTLDSTQAVCYPAQPVSGKVTMNFIELMEMLSIQLRMIGESNNHRSTSRTTRKGTHQGRRMRRGAVSLLTDALGRQFL